MSRNLKEYYPGIRPKSTKSEMEARKKILMQIAKDYMAMPELTEQEKEKIRQENLRASKRGDQALKRIAAAKEKAKNRKEK